MLLLTVCFLCCSAGQAAPPVDNPRMQLAKRLIQEAYESVIYNRAPDYNTAAAGRTTNPPTAAAAALAAADAVAGIPPPQPRKKQRLMGGIAGLAAAAGYGGGGLQSNGASGDFLQDLFGGEDLSGGGGGLLGSAGVLNTRIRCVCKNVDQRPNMVQCEAPTCGVWMHGDCMQRPPSKPGQPQPVFYCDQCRAARADPFWELFDMTVLVPVVLVHTGQGMYEGGAMLQQQVGGPVAFTLTTQQIDLLQQQRQEFRLQVRGV